MESFYVSNKAENKILLRIIYCILISYNDGISLTKDRIVGRMSTKVSRRNPLLDFWA